MKNEVTRCAYGNHNIKKWYIILLNFWRHTWQTRATKCVNDMPNENLKKKSKIIKKTNQINIICPAWHLPNDIYFYVVNITSVFFFDCIYLFN